MRESPATAVALARRNPVAAELAASFAAPDRLEDTLHARDFLPIILKRKWTILIIFAMSALFSMVMTSLAPPVYRASTTIQIERYSPRVFDYKDLTPLDPNDDNQDFYQTNYELLKSRSLAERAVEEIGLRKSPLAAAIAADDKAGAQPQP